MRQHNQHFEHYHVNEAAALAALDGNRQLLRELAEMFCEDAPVLLDEMRTALDESDATTARRAIHSLKGLASTFFATNVNELAQRWEQEAASGNLATLKVTGAEEMSVAIQGLIDELVARQYARGR